MLQQFLLFNYSERLFKPTDRILVAVSGGKDSMALLHLMQQAKVNIGIAHCNFQLRGAESDGDEALVKNIAHTLKVPFYTTRFDTQSYAAQQQLSIQMAARELRYAWFETLREQENYDSIAVAHHQNDIVETILINLIRGTGITGMSGPKAKTGKIIRPLLCFTTADIISYVQAKAIAYREDSSNSSTKYLRNKVRLELLPLLRSMNPSIDQTLLDTIERLEDANAIEQAYVESIKSTMLIQKGDAWHLSIRKLRDIVGLNTVMYHVLSDFNFNNTVVRQLLEQLPSSHSGQVFLSSSHRLIRDREDLIIVPIKEAQQSTGIRFKLTELPLSLGKDSLRGSIQPIEEVQINSNLNNAYLDADKISEPLTWRYWQAGDRFYPLGMNSQKNVSDLLTDAKVPIHEKEQQTVLLSGDRIIWVVGQRIDQHYRITAETKKVLLLTRN